MKNSRKIYLWVLSALFAALTFVFTAFFKVPIVSGQGYVHFGDTVIYLCASTLPLPFALVSSAVAGALSDILGGYPIWAPATFIIKALLTVGFTSKGKYICRKNILACVFAVFITVFGYYAAEAIIYSNIVSPVYSVLWNFLQAVCSFVLYFIIGTIFDKIKIKNHIEGRN